MIAAGESAVFRERQRVLIALPVVLHSTLVVGANTAKSVCCAGRSMWLFILWGSRCSEMSASLKRVGFVAVYSFAERAAGRGVWLRLLLIWVVVPASLSAAG